ncbi:PepSY domain-containing protein [Pseudonocardia sp. NPDC049635]|uniref:PepSY domain-containing protein n=1 Tax=Pseudonocardia sp. NPDC049635 TaxID=3155506 RepID=UPI0033E4AAA1
MRTRTTVATIAATGLLLIGGGTALALGSGTDPDRTPVTPASVTAPELPGAGAAAASASDAGAAPAAPGAAQPAVDRATAERIALELVGAGRVTEVEFDREDDDDRDDRDDRDHWEIEIRDGHVEHEIDVDAATGEILDHDIDRDDD